MTENGKFKTRTDALPARARRLVAVARAWLWWERIWPAIWPGLGLAGLFIAIALTGALPGLPPLLHLLVLAFFGIGILGLLGRGLALVRPPSTEEAVRRIETASGLDHRPLSAYADVPSGMSSSDTAGGELWAAHRAWLGRLLGSMRAGIPEPGLARRDPLGLRIAVLLCLLVAMAYAGGRWDRNLRDAIDPGLERGSGLQAQLDAWISPPTYTGRPPLFLTGESTTTPSTLNIPEGSELVARVTGGRGEPELVFTPAIPREERSSESAFSKVSENAFELSHILTGNGTVAVRQDGKILGSWPVTLLPDDAPTIRLTRDIETTDRGVLRFSYQVSDDYGVTSAFLHVERVPEDPHPSGIVFPVPDGEAITEDLPLPGLRVTEGTETAYRDLTEHPWAGLKVRMKLVARDEGGQLGSTPTIVRRLPERPFTDPLARAVIEQRRMLALDSSNKERIARFLDLFTYGADDYIDDMSVYLGLRVAYWKLRREDRRVDVPEVIDLLWDVALRIEDGDLSLADRDLRAAEEALRQALLEGAPPEEIGRLVDELKQALDRYLQALAREAGEMAEGGEMTPFDPNVQTLTDENLKQMLDSIGDLARTGAHDQARQLLSELQEILENLQTGMAPSQLGSGDTALGESLDALGDLIDQQQELMDRTYQSGQALGPNRQPGDGAPMPGEGGDGAASAGALEGQQGRLRRQLQELMQELMESRSGVPTALNRAERAMRDAEEDLRDGMAGDAVGSQGKALDQLRSGAQTLAQQFLNELAERMSGRNGRGDGTGRTDPLGRPLPGTGPDLGESVTVPGERELQRAREILEELQRRAADRGRPAIELDYLERLLRRF